MRQLRLLPLLLLLSATACVDTPVTPELSSEVQASLAVSTAQLNSGYAYLCALRNGKIKCFGEHDEAQPVGLHTAATGRFVALTAGAMHACGLRDDGAVECFGNSDYAQAPALRQAATGTYVAVTGGLTHSCALRTDGVAECWGASPYGQAPPTRAAQSGRFTHIGASANRTCAVRDDGRIECWGREAPALRNAPSGTYVELGESLGNTSCALTSTGVADCWGYQNAFHTGPYVQVVAGGGFQCALRPTGVPDCWGYPGNWETSPERGLTAGVWQRISAGNYHACGLRADGYFECFGVQSMGSDAPDVVPVADVPASTLAGAQRIRVSWRDMNSNETRSEVERSVTDRDRNPTTWTAIGAVAANRTSFTDSVALNATYAHRLRVCNNAGCSEWQYSNATAVPAGVPPAPSRVMVGGYACSFASCAKLSWLVDNTFVETFRLQRRVNTGGGYGPWQDLLPQNRTTTSYDDYGLDPGTSYKYRVRACNSRGCSSYTASNSFQAATPAPPNAPADLTASMMPYSMHLAWGDVANETTYEIQRRQYEGTAFGAWSEPIVRTMNITSTEDAVTPGTLYEYRIRACNDGGCSAYTYSQATRS